MLILFIGDVVGRTGRKVLKTIVPLLKSEFALDFVIANVENAAGGAGLTEASALEIRGAGVNVLTGGNHTWDKREIFKFIDQYEWLLRPANYPPGTPGRGWGIFESNNGNRIVVVNLMGRLFTSMLDCPFRKVEEILTFSNVPVKIVDFHAETTAEKQAFGYFLDGRITAVIGTHTHVQTADERILPNGTAYITDVGMTGGLEGVIGIKKELAVEKFVKQLPVRFEPSKEKPGLEGVLIEVNPLTGQAIKIERIRRFLELKDIQAHEKEKSK